MRTWKLFIVAAVLLPVGGEKSNAWAQEKTPAPAILHIQRSATTWHTGFPQFVYSYRVLDGVTSTAEARALSGTISLEEF